MVGNTYNKEIPLLDGVSVFVSPDEYTKYVQGALSLLDIRDKYCTYPNRAY